MVDVRVNRLRNSAALGSCEAEEGASENLLEMYDNMWYRGSRGDEENNLCTMGASFCRSGHEQVRCLHEACFETLT